jgi:hypothetical protein
MRILSDDDHDPTKKKQKKRQRVMHENVFHKKSPISIAVRGTFFLMMHRKRFKDIGKHTISDIHRLGRLRIKMRSKSL